MSPNTCIIGDLNFVTFLLLFGEKITSLQGADILFAASIQKVTSDCVVLLARRLREETGMEHLCLAGGVALNCVANSEVARLAGFKSVWVRAAHILCVIIHK